MEKPLKNTLVNSTLAFISAFFITTFIHESGHFISYIIFGADPVLYHNYVQTDDLQISKMAKIVSALAGPVISLFQGIVFALLVSIKRKNTVFYLFFLWLSLLGFVNFFGYLIMTPFSTTGDTGKAAEILEIAYLYRILIAFAGFGILIFINLKIGKYFSNFIPADLSMNMKNKYVYHIMFFPIIIGSIFKTIFAFPAPAVLSVIYPATSSYVIMISFGIILKSDGIRTEGSEIQGKIFNSMIFLSVFVILVNRLLTMGLG
ncbi:MAG: hypothetical protein EH225_04270 [Calditrichaeota bacterium]|nr:hypothetical protein [Calditrichota bacterium]RQW05800.1 MAG: hypothetical protein EH225_04270 [Calditrichota bacterium]